MSQHGDGSLSSGQVGEAMVVKEYLTMELLEMSNEIILHNLACETVGYGGQMGIRQCFQKRD